MDVAMHHMQLLRISANACGRQPACSMPKARQPAEGLKLLHHSAASMHITPATELSCKHPLKCRNYFAHTLGPCMHSPSTSLPAATRQQADARQVSTHGKSNSRIRTRPGRGREGDGAPPGGGTHPTGRRAQPPQVPAPLGAQPHSHQPLGGRPVGIGAGGLPPEPAGSCKGMPVGGGGCGLALSGASWAAGLL